jgi:SHAQKYF class myb-like DNA-binding protein
VLVTAIKEGHWTDEEHELFLQAVRVHGRSWKKLSEILKTRTNEQIRTHAQKYFAKLEELRWVPRRRAGGLRLKGRGLRAPGSHIFNRSLALADGTLTPCDPPRFSQDLGLPGRLQDGRHPPPHQVLHVGAALQDRRAL